MKVQYHPLRVAAVEADTRDSVLVSFEVPPELTATFQFLAGQHLNLRTRIGAAGSADEEQEELRRSYSICAAPPHDALRIAVKRQPGGRFSNWVHDSLAPGAVLEVLPPVGRFHFPFAAGRRGNYLLIAAGSGITPVYSLLKTGLPTEPESRFTLIYGNRASGAMMLREPLADLKDRYLDRLSLVHVMSREQQEGDLLNGRITPERLPRLLDAFVAPGELDAAFLCGPGDMNRALGAVIEARGVPRERILAERFASSRPGIGQAPPPQAEECEVEVLLDGRRHSFHMAQGRESLLTAGLRHGLEMRYSCQSGVCATCRAKLVEGQVDMDGNFALEDYEIARGFILTCQSFPVTARVAVDFDQDS